MLELIEDHRGDTYRAVYTVRFATRVYVLHVFQKKSKRGIATPQRDIELIRARLKWADPLKPQRKQISEIDSVAQIGLERSRRQRSSRRLRR